MTRVKVTITGFTDTDADSHEDEDEFEREVEDIETDVYDGNYAVDELDELFVDIQEV